VGFYTDLRTTFLQILTLLIVQNRGYLINTFPNMFAREKPMKLISAHHLSPFAFDGVYGIFQNES